MKLSFINCNHENILLHDKNNSFYETSNIDYISKIVAKIKPGMWQS